jgi:hypothetical protein
MVESLQDALIVLGLGGVGVLWVLAAAGALQVVWVSMAEPLFNRLKKKE